MFDYNINKGRIRAYGVIGDDFEGGIGPGHFIEALDAMDGRDVTIHLQSDGGSVTDGLSIFNQLEMYPGKVSVSVDSMAASIASVMMLAGDTVEASRNATIMVHDPWAAVMGNARAFRGIADVLDTLGGQLAETYASKAGGDVSHWLEVMANETYFSAEDALAAGLIDSISGGKAKAATQRAAARAYLNPALATKLAAQRLKLRFDTSTKSS